MKIRDIKIKLIKILEKQKKRSSQNISYIQAKEILKTKNAILVDVRSTQEYKEYHLEGAISIPLYDLKENIEKIISNKTTTIIVYCQSGGRSKKAISILANLGYTNIYNLEGGIENI